MQSQWQSPIFGFAVNLKEIITGTRLAFNFFFRQHSSQTSKSEKAWVRACMHWRKNAVFWRDTRCSVALTWVCTLPKARLITGWSLTTGADASILFLLKYPTQALAMLTERKPDPMATDRTGNQIQTRSNGDRKDPTMMDRKLDPMVTERKLDPTPIDRKIDPMAIDRKLDPMATGRKLDPLVVDRKLDPMAIGRKLDPMVIDRKLDPMVIGRELDPRSRGLACVQQWNFTASDWWYKGIVGQRFQKSTQILMDRIIDDWFLRPVNRKGHIRVTQTLSIHKKYKSASHYLHHIRSRYWRHPKENNKGTFLSNLNC